jgi:putative membrane protein
MGTADLIPGVSGGTIALVLGIYERLVNSIKEGSTALGAILKADVAGFKQHLGRVEWVFLLPLFVGILTAVISLSTLLAQQLEERPTILAGVFFGLVLGSVIVALRLLRDPKPIHLVVGILVAAALFLILGLGGEDTALSEPSLAAYFGAGALAICAMILPGISGSLILLLIGMYAPVLDALNDRELLLIGVFILGAIVGLAIFSQVLHWALRRHHDLILAALIGLMAGSLRVVWPWPEGVESAALAAPGDDWVAVTVAAVIGFLAVFAIARLAPSDADEISEPLPAG